MIVFNENLSARAIVGIACSFLAAAYYRRIKVQTHHYCDPHVDSCSHTDLIRTLSKLTITITLILSLN